MYTQEQNSRILSLISIIDNECKKTNTNSNNKKVVGVRFFTNTKNISDVITKYKNNAISIMNNLSYKVYHYTTDINDLKVGDTVIVQGGDTITMVVVVSINVSNSKSKAFRNVIAKVNFSDSVNNNIRKKRITSAIRQTEEAMCEYIASYESNRYDKLMFTISNIADDINTIQ